MHSAKIEKGLRRNFHLREPQFLKAIFHSLEVEVEGVEFFEFAFLEMLRHVVIALVWRILMASDRESVNSQLNLDGALDAKHFRRGYLANPLLEPLLARRHDLVRHRFALGAFDLDPGFEHV